MLDPDRAIAFTHESDGQPPRGAGLRPGPLLWGRTFTGGVEIQKTRSQNYSEIFFGLTTVTVSSDQSLKRSGSFLSPLPVVVFVGFGVHLGAPQ